MMLKNAKTKIVHLNVDRMSFIVSINELEYQEYNVSKRQLVDWLKKVYRLKGTEKEVTFGGAEIPNHKKSLDV